MVILKPFWVVPVPFAEGMQLYMNQFGCALFDFQGWLGHTSAVACAAEKGLEDFY